MQCFREDPALHRGWCHIHSAALGGHPKALWSAKCKDRAYSAPVTQRGLDGGGTVQSVARLCEWH